MRCCRETSARRQTTQQGVAERARRTQQTTQKFSSVEPTTARMSTGAYSSFRSHINHRTKAARTNRERLNRGGWAQMESALGTAAAPPPAPSPREIEAFNNFGFDGVSSNRTLSIGEVAVGLRQLRQSTTLWCRRC